jgi:hypothetical protein
LNRFDDAKRLVETAFARHIDSVALHQQRFELAFVRGDRQTMAIEAAVINGRLDKSEVRDMEARVAAFEGQLSESRKHWSRAEEQAVGDEAREIVRAYRAMVEAAVGARRDISDLDSRPPTAIRDWIIAALLAGDYTDAEVGLRALQIETLPQDRRPQYYERARVFLMVAKGDRSAIDQLPAATMSEFTIRAGHRLVYLRGLAYLHSGAAVAAACRVRKPRHAARTYS